MKILTAEQIRALDRYTMAHEPVSELNLMERAAARFTEAVLPYLRKTTVHVFCGTGNNGGDGLVIARLLRQKKFRVTAYILPLGKKPSHAFAVNLKKLGHRDVVMIKGKNDLPRIHPHEVIIDALLGSGISRPADGLTATVIEAINRSGASVFSVDVPSGLMIDSLNHPDAPIVHAKRVFTFHAPKFSFLLPCNEKHVPQFEVIDIGLHPAGADELACSRFYVDAAHAQRLLKPRKKFSHKGDYGHALIAAGSEGKAGAAILCVGAALRTGAGLVTALVPDVVANPLLAQHAEAMTMSAGNTVLEKAPSLELFSAVAVGPGMGTTARAKAFLGHLLRKFKKPMVLDADALNILSANPALLKHLTAGSVLTPHPGEFKRLCGAWKDDMEKLNRQLDFAKQHKVVVVLKGAYTTVATPAGQLCFNSTGNPGMAKGGSGDVLTGIIASLLAQQYSPEDAAVLGVYVHGLAGDMASNVFGETAMKAGDLLNCLPDAFKQLEARAVADATGSFY